MLSAPQSLASLVDGNRQAADFFRLLPCCSAPKVVAVVGAGHLAGIRDNWEAEIDIEEIQRMPPRRRSWVPMLLLAAGTVTITTFVVVRWRRSGQ